MVLKGVTWPKNRIARFLPSLPSMPEGQRHDFTAVWYTFYLHIFSIAHVHHMYVGMMALGQSQEPRILSESLVMSIRPSIQSILAMLIPTLPTFILASLMSAAHCLVRCTPDTYRCRASHLSASALAADAASPK